MASALIRRRVRAAAFALPQRSVCRIIRRLSDPAGMAELVDAADSKSAGGDTVRVRVPLPAPPSGIGRSAGFFSLLHDRARRFVLLEDSPGRLCRIRQQ